MALGLIRAQYHVQLSSYYSIEWKIDTAIEVFGGSMRYNKWLFLREKILLQNTKDFVISIGHSNIDFSLSLH